MKVWSLSALAFLCAWPAMGCSLIAGIDNPITETDGGGTDATTITEGGGSDTGADAIVTDASDANTSDGGVDAADASQSAEDGGNDASPDSGAPVEAGSPLGAPCSGDAGGGCSSGFCVDGVCCDNACTGQCEACDVPDAGGTCAQVSGAPHGGRAACEGAGTACAGTCAPTNTLGCTYPGSATSCRAESCTGGTVTEAAGCNGSGSCPPPTTVTCSNPDSCNAAGTNCANACTSDGQCSGSTPYCNSGACLSTMENGSPCTAATACTSGLCVDGYCCNAACSGECQACDVSGSLGLCSAVPAGDQPHGTIRSPCVGAGAGVCGGACQTASTAECTYPGSSISCRTQSCSGSTETLGASCNGLGSCPAVSTASCSPYECNDTGTACATICTSDADCTTGDYCAANGTCASQKAQGVACNEAAGGDCAQAGCRECAAGAACAYGYCGGVCAPGSTECTSATQQETCGTNAQWETPATTCPGACVGTVGVVGGKCATTVTYQSTGAAQSFTVPAGITSVSITANGAQGGTAQGAAGGEGASVTATITVTPGESLAIYVGGMGSPPAESPTCDESGTTCLGGAGGFNGGGSGGPEFTGGGAGGGGASDVRQGGSALSNRVVVAAGGGGAGAGATGGNGGAPTGAGGVPLAAGGGGGASETMGGSGGTTGTNGTGTAGSLGLGGTGGGNVTELAEGAGGGGGGGYYGGGGGVGAGTESGGGMVSGGGGGGSSYAESSVTNFSWQAGVQSGNGTIVLTW